MLSGRISAGHTGSLRNLVGDARKWYQAEVQVGWAGLGLVAWIAVAVVLFGVAPPPPDAPRRRPEDERALQRATDIVVRETRAWQERHGDRGIPWTRAEGHLAIVIDDVGRELHVLDKLISLRYRLTFSVLPGAVYAAGAQLRLAADRRRYREVLLHLPMEPWDALRMQQGAEADESFLLIEDRVSALRRKTEAALQRVPAAVGVNNHMGSRLTSDRSAMDAIMPLLAERGLFFLDSRTDAATTAAAAAADAGVPHLSRSVFLDHENDEASMTRQLHKAARRAREQPTVAIGHPSAALYQVLQRELPQLLDRGVSVYPLSQLIARSRSARAVAR